MVTSVLPVCLGSDDYESRDRLTRENSIPKLETNVDSAQKGRGDMLRAKKVLETCLYVEDLEAAEAFYSGVLGMEKYAGVEGRHVFFRVEEGMFLLFNAEATQKESPTGIPAHGSVGAGHAAFEMTEDEVDSWRAHLEGHGVEIESDYTWPNGGRSLYFRDPSGNSIEFVTRRTWKL